MNDLSPIALFVYNRPEHTKKTLKALQENKLASDSELYIYSDAAKNSRSEDNVNAVRELIKQVDGFKKITVIKQTKNQGLANSIITGVTEIVNLYGKIIVLEDDLITSTYFLTFMNDALKSYQDDIRVASIHGYIYPIDDLSRSFFIKGADCWGWATWKRGWDIFEKSGVKLLKELNVRRNSKEADFNDSFPYTDMLKNQIIGKNDSWAIRWYMSCFLQDKITLYPGQSFVHNIGNDDSGTHSRRGKQFDVDICSNYMFQKVEVVESVQDKEKIENYFRSLKISRLRRLSTFIIRLFS